MSEHTFFQRVQEILKKVATSLFTRDAATFLFFVLIAFLFWVMHSSSSNRNMKMKVNIEYVGIPQNVQIVDSLPTTTTIVVRDKGSVLWHYYFERFPTIKVDLSKKFNNSGVLEYDMNELIARIMTQFPATTQLYDSDISQLKAQYNLLESKEVPIALQESYAPAMPYVLKDEIKIVPNTMLIHAPHELIAQIDTLYLEPITEKLNKSTSISQQLIPLDGVQFEQNSVDVEVPIEISTEKKMEIPIVGVGLPQQMTLRTFPSEATISFNVGLSKFHDIAEEDFQVVVYYDSLEHNASQKAKLYFNKKPKGIHQLRAVPQEVDYISEFNFKNSTAE